MKNLFFARWISARPVHVWLSDRRSALFYNIWRPLSNIDKNLPLLLCRWYSGLLHNPSGATPALQAALGTIVTAFSGWLSRCPNVWVMIFIIIKIVIFNFLRHFWASGASRLNPACFFGAICNQRCSKRPHGDPFEVVFAFSTDFPLFFYSFRPLKSRFLRFCCIHCFLNQLDLQILSKSSFWRPSDHQLATKTCQHSPNITPKTPPTWPRLGGPGGVQRNACWAS